MGPWPYKELRRKGAKGRQKNIKGGAKTALKAAPLQKASEGAPERRPEGARTASSVVPKGRSRVHKMEFIGAPKGSSRGAKRTFNGAPKGCSRERKRGVQRGAKMVSKGLQKRVFKRMPQ